MGIIAALANPKTNMSNKAKSMGRDAAVPAKMPCLLNSRVPHILMVCDQWIGGKGEYLVEEIQGQEIR